MKRLKTVIVRSCSESDEKVTECNRMEKAANALMNASGYAEYVAKHGYHFTPELADKVCGDMANTDGTNHHWEPRQVLAALGNSVPAKATIGDMTYLANMAYADFFPKVIQAEASCIDYAKAVVGDVDGYEGMAFCRWTADAIGKAVDIDWEEFI